MLIKNARIVTWGEKNLILSDSGLLIKNGKIAEIGPSSELEMHTSETEILDARNQIVMPGNICAHTHFYGAFARGMAIPGNPPRDFPEILEKLWWPLDRSLTMKDVYLSAQVMLIDAIKNGTTTLFDHHASPNALSGSLDTIAQAVEKSGLRAVLCYEVTDRDGIEKSKAGITENLSFLDVAESPKNSDSRIKATFGLHASMTLSDETLQLCRESVPDEFGFHVHVAEHEADEYDSINKSGIRVVDRLKKFGILGPKTIIAHAVHVDAKEVEILAETGTWVSHQPRSNMNNGVGVAEIDSMMRAGVKMCIGTDGFSHTMWQEWMTAYLLAKVWNRDPRRLGGDHVVQMGVYNNAALANQFFSGAKLGVIEPGAYADLILVDYKEHTPMTPGNLPWQILFGFNEGMVNTTIVNGEILMKDRRILVLDENEIFSEAKNSAPEVWERYQQQFI